MLMHFTPGCESQASFRAVDEPVVVVVVVVDPPTAVVVEDEPPVVVLAPSDPRGGNVTVELVLSSPPHEDSTRAAATVATRIHTRRGRGMGKPHESGNGTKLVPGTRLCPGGSSMTPTSTPRRSQPARLGARRYCPLD
jgi:hypothetical protein